MLVVPQLRLLARSYHEGSEYLTVVTQMSTIVINNIAKAAFMGAESCGGQSQKNKTIRKEAQIVYRVDLCACIASVWNRDRAQF